MLYDTDCFAEGPIYFSLSTYVKILTYLGFFSKSYISKSTPKNSADHSRGFDISICLFNGPG